MTDQREINEAEWNEPSNWSWGVYRSQRDTRVWVPKRPKWTGWTTNVAHRAGVLWLVVLIAVPLLIAAATLIGIAISQ